MSESVFQKYAKTSMSLKLNPCCELLYCFLFSQLRESYQI